MSDILLRIEGRAARATLNRPEALNALSHEMCRALDAALCDWAAADVDLVILDATGARAFCAGGDITEMHSTGRAGDYDYGRRFWRDEYRMNARLAEYPKPVVSFLQGFVMGGGVGVGCHASHRIVGDTSRIAMPECAIGLVPDVGGSALLARAPGALGTYLGVTGARMGPGDAIHAGFADHYLPELFWEPLKARLCATGDADLCAAAAQPSPPAPLAEAAALIDRLFEGTDAEAIRARLRAEPGDFAAAALAGLDRAAPLSVAVTVRMLADLRAEAAPGLRAALRQEYRFTYRAMEQADFIEGIRAAVIDKDRSPRWRLGPQDITPARVAALLAPLGDQELTFEEEKRA